MGVSKTDLFTKKQNELANIARALGHPARIAILQHLVKINACICNDLVNELGLAQPAAEAGVIACVRASGRAGCGNASGMSSGAKQPAQVKTPHAPHPPPLISLHPNSSIPR